MPDSQYAVNLSSWLVLVVAHNLQVRTMTLVGMIMFDILLKHVSI